MSKVTLSSKVVYMMVSMSVGILASLILIVVEDILALQLLAKLVIGALVTIIIAGLAYLPIALSLRQITTALSDINRGKITQKIDVSPLGLLSGLVAETNKLVERQSDFQSMRGRLYEQISEVAAQEERNRLARDLHDSIKQQVFSMSVSAAAAHAHMDSNIIAAKSALLDVRQSAQEAMVEMRVLLQQLAPAPLEQSGLIESIRQQMEALSYRTGAKIETHFDKLPSDEVLPIGAQETLFRITQETLSNIARHARAKNVSLNLKMDADKILTMTIIDDGHGFDINAVQRGMGLNNMQRRVDDLLQGEIEIDSHIGKGTTLKITLPLEKQESIDDIKASRKAHKELAQTAYHRYLGTTGSISGFIFVLIACLRSLFNGSPVAIPIVLGIVSLFIAMSVIFFWGKYRKEYENMMQHIQKGDSAYMLFKHHQHECQWLIWFVCALVIPGAFVGREGYLWLPSFIGLGIALFIAWTTGRIIYSHHQYLASLMPFELSEALQTHRVALGSGIAVTIFSAMSIILPKTSTGFYLFPANSDEWDSNFFASMIVTLVIYHSLSAIVYFYWRNRHQTQGAIP
ncbi:MAG: hypothetical protein Phog2KO_18840 [Phototrophicaceae bacterium]